MEKKKLNKCDICGELTEFYNMWGNPRCLLCG